MSSSGSPSISTSFMCRPYAGGETATPGRRPNLVTSTNAGPGLDPGVRDCGVRSSLRPVAVGFLLFGFYAGAFAVAAIDLEHTFHLSDAQLGFLLAAGIVAATGLAAVSGIITDR